MTYLKSYVQYDGSEQRLEELLMWIGEVAGRDPEAVRQMSIDATTHGSGGRGWIPILFTNHKTGESIEVYDQDRIHYREFHGFYHTRNTGVLEFNDPEDHFTITNRGVCFTSSRWKLPEGIWEPWDLTGRWCRIDGVAAKITGIDAFASHRSPSSPYRHSFVVCVDEEDAERILAK